MIFTKKNLPKFFYNLTSSCTALKKLVYTFKLKCYLIVIEDKKKTFYHLLANITIAPSHFSSQQRDVKLINVPWNNKIK